MELFDFDNPIVLTLGGIALLLIMYGWNKRNASNQRNRRHRSFRDNYYQRKKDKSEETPK
jgi:hypothetical protein